MPIGRALTAVFGIAITVGVSTCSGHDYADDGEFDTVNVIKQGGIVVGFAIQKTAEAGACAYYTAVEEARNYHNPCDALVSGEAYKQMQRELDAL